MHHNVTQKECKRCGKCCVAGGPALHIEDRNLVVTGRLKPSHLITFRSGEPAYDPRRKRIVFLKKELIKIRGREKIGACMFYDKDKNSCTVYSWRPLECRLLKCWDTSDLEEVYMKRLLTRRHLIPDGSILYTLIDRYETLFGLEQLCAAAADLATGKSGIVNRLKVLIDKDLEFRRAVIRDFSVSSVDLDFFLGRPVSEILAPMIGDS